MKTKYCCDQKSYEDYYLNQAGNGIPGFHGTRYQRGAGLGSLLTGLLRQAAPLLKKGAIALGKFVGSRVIDKGIQFLGNKKGIKRGAPSTSSTSRVSKRKKRTSNIF